MWAGWLAGWLAVSQLVLRRRNQFNRSHSFRGNSRRLSPVRLAHFGLAATIQGRLVEWSGHELCRDKLTGLHVATVVVVVVVGVAVAVAVVGQFAVTMRIFPFVVVVVDKHTTLPVSRP